MVRLYITFGQVHVHSINGHTLDKDCVAVIKGPTVEHCDKLAFEWLDGKFHQHTTTMPDMTYFPRGLIAINQYGGDDDDDIDVSNHDILDSQYGDDDDDD